uniref:Uncharacterized protein n=1 Tax=Anguilla anguilla TaxID=7936 RepID=A0A0E9TH48_ANGAN
MNAWHFNLESQPGS